MSPAHRTFELPSHGVLRREIGSELGEVQVRCLSGTIWLTEEGGGDVLLGAGETLTATREGVLVLEALDGPARVEVTERSLDALTRPISPVQRVVVGASLLLASLSSLWFLLLR